VVQHVASSGAPGGTRTATWGIAVEAPVQLLVDDAPWTVQMATPADLDDLAVGLAITEGLVRDIDGIAQVEVRTWLGEHAVALTLATGAPVTARRTAASTACGLCGIESLAALQQRQQERQQERQQQRVAGRRGRERDTRAPISADAALRATDGLAARQPLNAATRSVHAAAWCHVRGDIVLVREDVGRHNALDKLVGALAAARRLDDDGFIVMSSRCSYELVAKASHTSARLLVCASAPTSLALTWATALDVPVATASRAEGRTMLVTFPDEAPHADG